MLKADLVVYPRIYYHEQEDRVTPGERLGQLPGLSSPARMDDGGGPGEDDGGPEPVEGQSVERGGQGRTNQPRLHDQGHSLQSSQVGAEVEHLRGQVPAVLGLPRNRRDASETGY